MILQNYFKRIQGMAPPKRCCLKMALLMMPCAALHAQKPELGGYVSAMPSIVAINDPQETYWQSLAHNRLNLGWSFGAGFRLEASARTRFLAGDGRMFNVNEIGADQGIADLSWNVFEAKNTVLNTTLDRLNFSFEKDKISLKFGRQRINWGQNFVWNPNDLFNAYSFFDFDYVERPGCDAFRGTYYHSAASQTEIAVSASAGNEITAAAMHRFNRKNFDFQAIGGLFRRRDLVLGGAWCGDIRSVGFRGEFTVFQPLNPSPEAVTTLAASAGVDYTFKNSLFLQAEALYNPLGGADSSAGLLGVYAADLSAKTLSISEWNIFAQASYPFSPIISGSLSAMHFPDIRACYAGVALDVSLLDNLDLSFISQFFATAQAPSMQAALGFARLKYNF
jgi:hypothetical protein